VGDVTESAFFSIFELKCLNIVLVDQLWEEALETKKKDTAKTKTSSFRFKKMINGAKFDYSVMHTQKRGSAEFDKAIWIICNIFDEIKRMKDFMMKRIVAFDYRCWNLKKPPPTPVEQLPCNKIKTTNEMPYIFALMAAVHKNRKTRPGEIMWPLIRRFCPDLLLKEKLFLMRHDHASKEIEALMSFFLSDLIEEGDGLSCTRREFVNDMARFFKRRNLPGIQEIIVNEIMKNTDYKDLIDVRSFFCNLFQNMLSQQALQYIKHRNSQQRPKSKTKKPKPRNEAVRKPHRG